MPPSVVLPGRSGNICPAASSARHGGRQPSAPRPDACGGNGRGNGNGNGNPWSAGNAYNTGLQIAANLQIRYLR